MTHADTIFAKEAYESILDELTDVAIRQGYHGVSAHVAMNDIYNILEREGFMDNYCKACWEKMDDCECGDDLEDEDDAWEGSNNMEDVG